MNNNSYDNNHDSSRIIVNEEDFNMIKDENAHSMTMEEKLSFRDKKMKELEEIMNNWPDDSSKGNDETINLRHRK